MCSSGNYRRQRPCEQTLACPVQRCQESQRYGAPAWLEQKVNDLERDRIDCFGTLGIETGQARGGRIPVQFAILQSYNRRRARLEKFCRTVHYGIEHRLDVGGRTRDHLEDVGGCSLPLQRIPGLVE